MGNKYTIEYLSNDEINFVKWDNCINNSHNGNIYAFSWYLDILCEDWEALADADYKSVMPILPAKKMGIPVTYTSYLANQLGVFSTDILSEEKVNAFILKLSETYKAFDVNLNKFNKVSSHLFKQTPIETYEFDIIRDYSTISKGYSGENQVMLKLADKNSVSIVNGLLPNDFLDFASRRDVLVSAKLKRNDLLKLRRIIAFVMRHGLGEINAAYGPDNELIAAVFFLKSNRKISVLFSAVSDEGLKLKTMNKIIDRFIYKYSGQNLTLSFENLQVPDKASFCKGFGGKEFLYNNITNPQIPWYSKLLLALSR